MTNVELCHRGYYWITREYTLLRQMWFKKEGMDVLRMKKQVVMTFWREIREKNCIIQEYFKYSQILWPVFWIVTLSMDKSCISPSRKLEIKHWLFLCSIKYFWKYNQNLIIESRRTHSKRPFAYRYAVASKVNIWLCPICYWSFEIQSKIHVKITKSWKHPTLSGGESVTIMILMKTELLMHQICRTLAKFQFNFFYVQTMLYLWNSIYDLFF